MKVERREKLDWFSVHSALNDEPAEVFIYGFIGRDFFGDGVDPSELMTDVKALKMRKNETLNVHINSKGGDFHDGNTIYNFLQSIKQKVVVTVDGLAASAASIIAMAGDVVVMPENSYLMIHNPHAVVGGESKDFRKIADDLDKMKDGAVRTYSSKVNGKTSSDDIATMMDDSTWLNASESIDMGFADEIIDPVRAAAFAGFNLKGYLDNVPDILVKIQEDAKAQNAERRANVVRLKGLTG